MRVITDFDLLDIPANEERKREAYRQKITECIDRAEKLKVLVNQEKGTVSLHFNNQQTMIQKILEEKTFEIRSSATVLS